MFGEQEPLTISTVIAIATAIVATLAGTVVFPWRMFLKNHERVAEKLDQRETQLNTEKENRLVLSERVGKLEGRLEGYDFGKVDGKLEQLKTQQGRLEEIHGAVLNTIRKSK